MRRQFGKYTTRLIIAVTLRPAPPKKYFERKYAFGVRAAHIFFNNFPSAARSHQLRLDGIDESICEVGVSSRRELHFCTDRASRLDETLLLTLVCSCAARRAVALARGVVAIPDHGMGARCSSRSRPFAQRVRFFHQEPHKKYVFSWGKRIFRRFQAQIKVATLQK